MGRTAAVEWAHGVRKLMDTANAHDRNALKARLEAIEHAIGTMARQEERMHPDEFNSIVEETIELGHSFACERRLYLQTALLYGDATPDRDVMQAILPAIEHAIAQMEKEQI